MQGAAWHRAARRDEARILARAYLISAVVLVLVAAFPYSPTTPRYGLAALSFVALTIGATLQAFRPRVLSWHVQAALGLATVGVSLCVASATVDTGAVLATSAYTWIAVFSAVFHRPRVLLRHLAWIGLGAGVGLWIAGVPSPVETWLVLCTTSSVVAVVLNGRVVDLRREATTDPLTGVLTRRAFHHAAELEMARAERTGQALTLVLVDLDDFKRINDEEGHAAGDAVLVGITESWKAVLRPEDVLGRFGGDEFMLVLPRTDLAGTELVLERLRSDLCGWTAGVAVWRGEGLQDWITAADQDLYAAKTDPQPWPEPEHAGEAAR